MMSVQILADMSPRHKGSGSLNPRYPRSSQLGLPGNWNCLIDPAMYLARKGSVRWNLENRRSCRDLPAGTMTVPDLVDMFLSLIHI